MHRCLSKPNGPGRCDAQDNTHCHHAERDGPQRLCDLVLLSMNADESAA
jgi:hypothetical protein